MKRALLIFLTAFLLIGAFGYTHVYAASDSEKLDVIKKDSTSIFDKVSNFFDDIRKGFIVAAMTIFCYITSFLLVLFNLLFNWISSFLKLLIDFSRPEYYGTYKQTFLNIRNLVFLVAFGFLFILFVNSVVMSFVRGQNPVNAIFWCAVAVVLLISFPFIYSKIWTVAYYLSEALFKSYDAVAGKQQIFTSLTNAGAYFGMNTDKAQTPWISNTMFMAAPIPMTMAAAVPINGAQVGKFFIDYTTIILEVDKQLKAGNTMFFINQIIIFILCGTGIYAIIEVAALKGAQIINLFIAFFTGIIACTLVASDEMRGTFKDWLVKYIQLLSYNFLWALVLLAINLFAYKLTGAGEKFTILYFVMIFAGFKLLSKVGGIAEGLIMSRSVMENFGTAFKNDIINTGGTAVMGGFAAVKMLSAMDSAKKVGAKAMGAAAVSGNMASAAAGAGIGAGTSINKNESKNVIKASANSDSAAERKKFYATPRQPAHNTPSNNAQQGQNLAKSFKRPGEK